MKARLPKLSQTQLKKARAEVGRILKDDMQTIARRMNKLVCIALNNEFGFGAERLSRTMLAISALADEAEKDSEFWTHADIRLEQIGCTFKREEQK